MATSLPIPFASIEPPKDPHAKSTTPQAQPVEDLKLICLHENFLNRQVKINTSLQPSIQVNLIAFLRQNSMLFA